MEITMPTESKRTWTSTLLGLAVIGMAVGLSGTALAQSSGATAATVQLKEEGFVQIGGIGQWITIKGDDKRNPVILFLHGGPGDASSPYSKSLFGTWEKDFTLVQRDQRGAGRTYGKTGPSIEATMTLDRMVQDGIEVSEYLTKHLGKKKIILVGGSWGSILGIYMAKQRPDLFYAYIGMAQLVNERAAQAASYARVLQLARAADDREVVKALEANGPPPWDSLRKWPVFHKALLAYQAKRVTAASPPTVIDPAYASPAERAQYEEADDFSWVHFFGMTMSGPMETVDLPALGTDFAIPIFFVQGQEDLTALPELAKAYLDTIKAPQKQFISVPGTGHEDSAESLRVTLELLRTQVRPNTIEQ
jgi:pimeloyl-ACP methyl ester carboxylesterase